jgi:hypothetical protein
VGEGYQGRQNQRGMNPTSLFGRCCRKAVIYDIPFTASTETMVTVAVRRNRSLHPPGQPRRDPTVRKQGRPRAPRRPRLDRSAADGSPTGWYFSARSRTGSAGSATGSHRRHRRFSCQALCRQVPDPIGMPSLRHAPRRATKRACASSPTRRSATGSARSERPPRCVPRMTARENASVGRGGQ